MDVLKHTLPKSDYDTLHKLYEYSYNTFAFIYKIDNGLIDQFNFIINYILHKEIEKNIMHNKICLGRTEVIFINTLDVFYIKLAGQDIILENILLEHKSHKKSKKKYTIVNQIDLELVESDDIFDKIFKNASVEYIKDIFKIIFYLELFNNNIISKEIIDNIKIRLNNYQLKNIT